MFPIWESPLFSLTSPSAIKVRKRPLYLFYFVKVSDSLNRSLRVLRFNLFRSNDYSHNDCQSDLKAMLLNKVIVGKGCKMTQDNTTLTAPPAGYDSVRIPFFRVNSGFPSRNCTGLSRERRESQLRRAGCVLQRRDQAVVPRNV